MDSHQLLTFALLFVAALWAGAQNALAGGGSFITLPALMLTGMDAKAANITSCVALFPGQVATGWAGRRLVQGTESLGVRSLVILSLVGGSVGAVLLLATPSAFFARLVPWLVLFATAVFAWGSFGRKPDAARRLGSVPTAIAQFLIAVYGGYFGGGIGFLMLAVLTLAGLATKNAAATKNVFAAAMNAAAVLVLAFSPEVRWIQTAIACVGALAGGVSGAWLLHRVDERLLRGFIILIGVALTVGLFLKS